MRTVGSWMKVVTVVTGALLAAACTSESPSEAVAEPWNEPDASWMQPAGTPLAEGVVVPEGARLVGPVFAQFDETKALQGEVVVGGQRGYLLVDGEPYAVATDFLDQWDGENTLGEYHRDTLFRQDVQVAGGKIRNYDYTGDPEPGAVEISCDVGLVLVAPTGDTELEQIGTGRVLSFNLTKDVASVDVPTQGTVDWPPPFIAIPDDLPIAPEGVDGPTSVASDVDYLPDLEIVDGSFLAGPPWPGSLTGGYTAIIGVTGNPDEVFDAYVSQDEDKPELTVDETVGEMRIREYRSSEAGGITYTVTLNEIDGNAWILVEAYND